MTIHILNKEKLIKPNYYWWNNPPKAYNELSIKCSYRPGNDIIIVPKNVEVPPYLQDLINNYEIYKGYLPPPSIIKSIIYLHYPNSYNPSFPNLVITYKSYLLNLSYYTTDGYFMKEILNSVDMSIIDKFFNLPKEVISDFITSLKYSSPSWNYSLTMEEYINDNSLHFKTARIIKR